MTDKAKTVLVVENQPNYTQQIVKQILFAGYTPVVAITGEGGIRKAIEHHADMILLEAELSDMDVSRFVSDVRRNPKGARVSIIAMSALPHLKGRCLQAGCDDFLQKPVKMLDLIANIKKYIRPIRTLTAL